MKRKRITRFIFLDGVWVTDFETFSDLVTVLRMNLIDISRIRAVKDQKESKLNDIYQYVTGNDFRQKVSAVMDTLVQMKNDLVVEKTSIQRLWSKREQHRSNSGH